MVTQILQFPRFIYLLEYLGLLLRDPLIMQTPGPEVIKLEYSLKLK